MTARSRSMAGASQVRSPARAGSAGEAAALPQRPRALLRHESPAARRPDHPALLGDGQRLAVAARPPQPAVDPLAEHAAVETLRPGLVEGGDDRLDLLVDVLVRDSRGALLHRRVRRAGLARSEALAAARALEARLALALGSRGGAVALGRRLAFGRTLRGLGPGDRGLVALAPHARLAAARAG